MRRPLPTGGGGSCRVKSRQTNKQTNKALNDKIHINDNEISKLKKYVRRLLQDYARLAWLMHSVMCHLNTCHLLRLQRIGDRWMNECGELVEWYWQGRGEILGEKCPRVTLSTINSTWSSLGLNAGLRGDKTTPNCLYHAYSWYTNTQYITISIASIFELQRAYKHTKWSQIKQNFV